MGVTVMVTQIRRLLIYFMWCSLILTTDREQLQSDLNACTVPTRSLPAPPENKMAAVTNDIALSLSPLAGQRCWGLLPNLGHLSGLPAAVRPHSQQEPADAH